MHLSFDIYNHLEEPAIYLTEVDKEIICKLPTIAAKASIKFNDISEVTFTTPKFFDSYENEFYDLIEVPRQILVEGVGYFTLQHPKIINDGVHESKECTAYSTECELAHKEVKNLIINTGTTGSIDDVVLCNKDNHEKSLLHLILEAIPNWEVGHIDPLLAKQMRFFDIGSQDVYSLLTNEIANTFHCIILFDTFNHHINVYPIEEVGEMTDVCIRMDTLAKMVEIDYDPDQIKTALYVYGADNLDVRECNMGLDKMICLDYFNTVDWMGEELYAAWNAYLKKWNSKKEVYTKLLQEYKNLLVQSSDIEYSNPDKVIDWESKKNILSSKNLAANESSLKSLASLLDSVGTKRLKGWLDTYELILADQATLGYGVEKLSVSSGVLSTDEAYDYYHQAVNQNYIDYLCTYNKILAVKYALSEREGEISDLEEEMEKVMEQMSVITKDLDWSNHFTEKQLKKLSYFIREDTYQDDAFLVTESMKEEEALDVKLALYEEGLKKIEALASPQLEFTMSMVNLLAIPEFSFSYDVFDVGNYIYVDMRDDYQVKVRILQIDFNFKDSTDFNCIFGTAIRYDSAFDRINDGSHETSSLITSASIAMSYWQKGGDAATEVDKIIKEGLDTALIEIKNSANNQSITWDETGIHLRRWNYDRNTYEPEECWMVNDKILFSDDNFQSAKSLFGRVNIGGEDRYVVIAEAMFAGLIEASMLVGNEITNGNGFYVDKYGNLTSTSGHIANWVITKDGLYSESWSTGLWSYYGNDTYTTDKEGNAARDHHSLATAFQENGALKTHYLAFWAGASGESDVHHAPFRVYSDGCMFAVSGSMGNWTISDAGLYYGNYITGMWGKEEHENNLQVQAPANDPVGGSSGIAIWAGNYRGYQGINRSPFMVTHDGHMYASRGKIACFIINEYYLESEDQKIGFGLKGGYSSGDSNPWALWIGWNGAAGSGKASFKVGMQGDITLGHSGGHDMVMKVEQSGTTILNFIDQGLGSLPILSYENNNGYWWKLGSAVNGLYPAANIFSDLGSANFRFKNLYLQGISASGDITAKDLHLTNDDSGIAVGKDNAVHVYSILDGFKNGENLKNFLKSTYATKEDLERAQNDFYDVGYNDGYDDGYYDGSRG